MAGCLPLLVHGAYFRCSPSETGQRRLQPAERPARDRQHPPYRHSERGCLREWTTLAFCATYFKFSCPQCGQPRSGTEQWSGHQIQCPTCATTLTVPQAPPPLMAAAPVPQSLVPQPPVSHGAKLSAGATQVARSTVPGPAPRRQVAARPPRTSSPLLKYGVYAIVLAALGWAGF